MTLLPVMNDDVICSWRSLVLTELIGLMANQSGCLKQRGGLQVGL